MIDRSLSGRSVIAIAMLFIFLTGSLLGASAQTADKAQTPEQKALSEARKIKDPGKKVDALEKYTKDYPNSLTLGSVHEMILDSLIKNWPDQKERILSQAEKAIDSASPWNKNGVYEDIADKLMTAHLMPEKAEEFAARGLAAAEKELEEDARKTKALYLGTLGRAYLNDGKTEQAEKALKEAHGFDPGAPGPSRGLAELAEKSGNFQEALRYEIAAFITNRSSEEPRSRTKLEELYRKTHGGSLDGLDAVLDAEYTKASPNPIEPKPYHPAGAQPDRTVLAELFTGSGCPPCTAADLAFDAAGERYPSQDLAILVYHLHIPRPDPMTNPSTQARATFYSTGSTPTYMIDGEKNQGGGGRDYANLLYNGVNSRIADEIGKPAEASIKLSASLENNTVKTEAVVDKIKSDAKTLKLQIALVEDTVRYSGENGIRFHNMVVRSLGGEKSEGFEVKAGGAANIKQQFDLAAISKELKKSLDDYEAAGHRGEEFTFTEKKYQIEQTNLSVVAFVQDPETKHVLQAVYVRVNPGPGPEGK
jgi:tetratricopeptide (TPR) repeat protein